MIRLDLHPANLTAMTSVPCVLRLENTGDLGCTGIRAELRPRPGLVMAKGSRRVRADWLAPGEAHDVPLALHATSAGSHVLDVLGLSYRDVSGRTYRHTPSEVRLVAEDGGDGIGVDPPAVRPADPGRATSHPHPPSIFVSHSRSDNAWFVRTLVDELRHLLRPVSVFVDADIAEGEKWSARLEQELYRSMAVVVAIGPRWAEEVRPVLRWEIATALARDVPILPILYDGAAAPPAADLPADVRGITSIQMLRVHRDNAERGLFEAALAVRALLPGDGGR